MAVDYGQLLRRAKEEELGLVVETNNPQQMQFSAINYIASNPQYREIMVCIPSIPDHVFFVKKSVELDP